MRPEWWTIDEWEELIIHRQKKKAVLSRRAFNGLLAEFELSRKRGYTAAEILDAMSSGKGWAGYKDEWVTAPPKKTRVVNPKYAGKTPQQIKEATLRELRERNGSNLQSPSADADGQKTRATIEAGAQGSTPTPLERLFG
jgi:hypothetical protein